MDLDSLRCFVAAAQHLNFRVASEAVALSPAAFSERIKRLEEEMGVRLFERTTRRVRLTPAGVRALPRVKRLLEDARRLVDEVRDDDAKAPYALTLGTRFELGLSWLVPALGDLKMACPERTIHLSFGNDEDLLARLRSGGLDAIVSSTRLSIPQLRYTLLHEERYVFVAAPGVCSPKLRSEDAPALVLIDAHPSLPLFRYYLDAAPKETFWNFGHLEFLGTIAAIRYRIMEGAGVAVLPRYFVEEDLAQGTLVRLREEIEPARDAFRLIWLEGHPLEQELLELATTLQRRPI